MTEPPTQFSPLYFKRLEAQRIQRVLDVVDESLREAAERREEREAREAERRQEAQRRKQRVLSRITAIESEEKRAVQRTIDRLAGDAQDAADDVIGARERKRRLLSEARRLDARA